MSRCWNERGTCTGSMFDDGVSMGDIRRVRKNSGMDWEMR